MEYVFWQNIVSPHQSVFLRTLAQNQSVTLVVENEMLPERVAMGWEKPDIGKTTLIVKPSVQNIDDILTANKEKTIHIFSGIYGNTIISQAFKRAAIFRCRIGLMSEPFNLSGIKGILKKAREKFVYYKYRNFVQFILAIGPVAVNQFKKTGYSGVFEWGYFVEPSGIVKNSLWLGEKFNIIYVGKLIERKAVNVLLDALYKIKLPYTLHIVGDGPMKSSLLKQIENLQLNSKVKFYSNIKIQEVRQYISACDLLILPSKFDGWGAVVNEALMEGTPVICSNKCGAYTLLANNSLGSYYPFDNNEVLAKLIEKRIINGKIGSGERAYIIDWALHKISGEVASLYFNDIVNYNFNFSGVVPIAPWKEV